MTRFPLLLVLLPLSLIGSPVQADSSRMPDTDPAQRVLPAVRPVVLVRVLALDGTGPDKREHRLFTDPQGFVTTLDAIGRVGYQVGAAGLGEGGYHTLFAELADEYQRVLPDGTQERRRFSAEGKATRVRVRGMVMVRNGEATPLRMLEDPSYYGSRRKQDDDD